MTKSQSRDRNFFRFIFGLVREYPRNFLWLLAVSLSQSAINGLTVILIAPIADVFLRNSEDSSAGTSRLPGPLAALFDHELDIQTLFVLFGGFLVISGIFAGLTKFVVLKIKYAVLVDLLTDTMSRFFEAQYKFFVSGELGKLLNSFQKEAEKLGDSFGMIVTGLVALLQVCVYLIIPAVVSPVITAQFLVITGLLTLPLWLLRRWAHRFGSESTDTANKVAKVLHENLTSAKLIIGFQKQQSSVDLYKKSFLEHAKAAVKLGTLVSGVNLLFVPIGTVGALIVIYYAIDSGTDFTALTMLLFAFFRALPLLATILQIKTNVESFVPAFQQIEELKHSAMTLKENSGATKFSGLNKGISFENIGFTYDNEIDILRQVNIFVPAREITAFIGRSGSGKSTAADLVMGLLRPTTGTVLVDGVSLDQYDLVTYRARIGFVPQEPHLFNSTIRENIAWANPNASEEEILLACCKANATEFISRFPEKLDFMVGDRGNRLSGGQRQRLALARALVRDPKLLVLDEPTSALDRESEKPISKALEKLSTDMTILIIAHREEIINMAQNVFMVEGGKMRELNARSE
jgi:ABC-type multidrug transport system fused ATPase/permease subunit